MKKALFSLILIFTAVCVCSAQSERKSVRSGNRDFRKSAFEKAEINYKKALVADSTSIAADYNLGNTYYKLENYTEADKYYAACGDSLAKESHGSDLFHNMGNSLVKQQKYSEAIEAYKNSLRRRPDDMETKANLAYAQKMLQNQQNQDQNNDQNNDQNQDQNQNQNQDQNQDNNQDQNQNQNQDQNKDQNKDNNQNQDQDQNQNNNQDNQDRNSGEQPQGQQPKITPQAAQQMLQAIQDQEKETQDKVKKEKALMMKSKQKEKNW